MPRQARLSSLLDAASLHLNGENADLLQDKVVLQQVVNHSTDGRLNHVHGIVLDRPLSSGFEEQAFDVLMSHRHLCELTIPKDADFGAIPALLQRALPIMPLRRKPWIKFEREIPIAAAEQAHEIFKAIQNSHVHHRIYFRDSNNAGFVSAMARHIQASTNLEDLLFLVQTVVSTQAIGVIFDAIAESTSLKTFGFYGHFVSNLDVAATENLAKALAKSESIREVSFFGVSITLERICRFLSQTDAVKNFDLSFDGREEGFARDSCRVTLTRPSRWKRLLPLAEIPLGLWSHILEEANRPTGQYSSHSNPKDVIYFLLRERNGMLTKNANGPRHTCALCATTFPNDAATDKLTNHCTQCDEHYCNSHTKTMMTYCAKCKEYHCRPCGYLDSACKQCAAPCFDCECARKRLAMMMTAFVIAIALLLR